MKEIVTLLGNRKFTHLWVSQIISQVVVNTLSFLMLIYLFEKTGSTIATSLVWLAYALPAIIFGPIASVTADLVDKRRALVVTLLLQAVIISVYSLLYSRFIYLAYGIVFIYSLANQFYIPAEAASIPILVKKKILPFANSLFFVTVQLSLAFGFLLAGISYEYLGLRSSLVLSSLLLLVAVSSVSLLPKLPPLEHIPRDFAGGIVKFFQELLEGYQFIKDTRRVFLPFFILIGLQVALSVVLVTIPALAENIVRVRPSLAGITIVFPGAVGALIATMVVSKAISHGFPRRRVIEISLFSLSLVLVLLGVVAPILPFWLGRTLSVVCFFIAGASYVGSLIPTLTHLQLATPKDKLGRVFGSIWFITTAATVLPVIFSATITEVFGVALTMTMLGVVGLIAFFVSRKL
ncbi:hypothetical protein A2803_00015 [Candidatus Woesebacteria bacterium RIFCSPHIGHO2_01_FULL_44_21]|uniref:Major facilitator superfamily (MFS) profile domain-containing protein n=1 Tax=Candidatus Woesebacteria bacterium RIFCSPHIGHO2_01_FULL_44_21 TaxID=1802503 RepID=A0A1F7Z383_9BACT|nr:MAG: hypothetical protein A2803_00015 [Candidatus Woesebacteria bacterium RIFCSPHIGHO2_01_FULL_44_21]OGM71139.1 MAG: hypothetical protein A2897_02870 [Candidatus Woesebacteria bacterium RIFCSPLOWO2_01_FULL_44_24b]